MRITEMTVFSDDERDVLLIEAVKDAQPDDTKDNTLVILSPKDAVEMALDILGTFTNITDASIIKYSKLKTKYLRKPGMFEKFARNVHITIKVLQGSTLQDLSNDIGIAAPTIRKIIMRTCRKYAMNTFRCCVKEPDDEIADLQKLRSYKDALIESLNEKLKYERKAI